MSVRLVHGVDLVEVARIAALIESHADRFVERVFTDAERAHAEGSRRRDEHLAARFAAKEAALKALGTGLRHGITWRDVHVTTDDAGRPLLHVEGQAAEFARSAGIAGWALSLSHAGGFALASVVGVVDNV